jgi:CRP-like cAMP-binding protein
MQQFFTDGAPLFHEGDSPSSLFLILHGQVCIAAGGIHLVSRGPYTIIGEQAFINGTNRSATARAQGTVRALVLPRDMTQLLLANAAFSRNFLRQLSPKLSEASGERAFRYPANRSSAPQTSRRYQLFACINWQQSNVQAWRDLGSVSPSTHSTVASKLRDLLKL